MQSQSFTFLIKLKFYIQKRIFHCHIDSNIFNKNKLMFLVLSFIALLLKHQDSRDQVIYYYPTWKIIRRR